MGETVSTYPAQVTGIDGERQAIVIILLAHRENERGESVTLTASQKEAARNAAQAALEITDGTEVLGTSTALLLPNDIELAEDESLTLVIDASVVKTEKATVNTEDTVE